MRHIFSLYPSGAAGAGLLMLRLHAALLLADLAVAQSALLASGFTILLLAIGLGLFARAATLVAIFALGALWLTPIPLPALHMASHIFGRMALALLGPGALSIDALRFGRKVISLP